MSFLKPSLRIFINESATKKLNWLWKNFSSAFRLIEISAKGFSLFAVGFYRVVFSPIFGGACRFEPSCSVYAEQALKQQPFLSALKLIIKRLIKCRPGGAYGLDPVPNSVPSIFTNCGCKHE